MALTRIVAQLDYVHEGASTEAGPLVHDLFEQLSEFAAACPGLELVVIGFAEAHDDADESCDGMEKKEAAAADGSRQHLR